MNETDIERLALKWSVAILKTLFVTSHVRLLSEIQRLDIDQSRTEAKQQIFQDLSALDQTLRTQILAMTSLSDDQRAAEIQALDSAIQAMTALSTIL